MPYLTERSPDTSPILARYGALLLCAVWLLAGVVGHDPWKNDDAVHLGVAFGMAGGDWLVPRVAGDPWLVTPPLFHWTAALCGQLLGWLLPWHDAARLASTLFAAGFLAVIWRIAHRQLGPSAGLAAPLLAIGTLGLLVPLHEAQPATAALAGFAVSLWGLSVWRDAPLRGGALFGAGIGISFLGTGVDSVAIQLATGLVLALHPAWRNRGSAFAWLIATAVALALILPWPLLLWQQSPALFDIWWTVEEASLTSRDGFSPPHLQLLAWASWPVLPLAAWGLWLERRHLLKAETALLLTAAATALFMFLTGTSTRPTSLFPALVPLILLATSAAGRLRRGAANAFDWFGVMTFTLSAGLIWLGGIAILSGEPARIAKNFNKLAPGFIAEVSAPVILIAIAVSVGWIAVMLRTPRSPWRAAARWSVGVAVIWVLLVALLLPWIDYGKSYRNVSADFREALGARPGCIARRGLGLAQRASLDYFDGIRTIVGSRANECRWLIVQTAPRNEKILPGWTLIRETSRPGDRDERLRLYRRDK
ncbi:MAG: glycosyltransferase family 39 protein [Candidatus Woesebacteria bacterium]|nr:glycosyltransferase family 39 protein [Candidatus Woesebacteria bacterium]